MAKSAPDGYTLLTAPGSSLTAVPHLQAVRFDPLRDFAAVVQTTAFSYMLVAHPSTPVQTARDLVALAKTRPGYLTYGSTGVGSGFHLAGEMFCHMADVKMLHVPYRGGGAAAGGGDLMAGGAGDAIGGGVGGGLGEGATMLAAEGGKIGDASNETKYQPTAMPTGTAQGGSSPGGGGSGYGGASQFGGFLSSIAKSQLVKEGVKGLGDFFGGLGDSVGELGSTAGAAIATTPSEFGALAGGAAEAAPAVGAMAGESAPVMMAAAKGGKVPAMVSAGERYLKPQDVAKVKKGANPMQVGEKIPGKPVVSGAKNSYANDVIPKDLDEGGIVLPRSVTQSKHPHWAAMKFVQAHMAQGGLVPKLKGKK